MRETLKTLIRIDIVYADGYVRGRRYRGRWHGRIAVCARQFWLSLSAMLRKLKVGHYIHLLPGVRRDPLDENVLIINTRIARILLLQIFHLLGFRRLRWSENYLVVSRRSYDLAGPTKLTL